MSSSRRDFLRISSVAAMGLTVALQQECIFGSSASLQPLLGAVPALAGSHVIIDVD